MIFDSIDSIFFSIRSILSRTTAGDRPDDRLDFITYFPCFLTFPKDENVNSLLINKYMLIFGPFRLHFFSGYIVFCAVPVLGAKPSLFEGVLGCTGGEALPI